MRHVIFLSSWTGNGGTTPYYCPIQDVWKANGINWNDLHDFGQPNVLPDPNIGTWEVWTNDAGVALLEADVNCFVLVNEAVVTAAV